MVEFRAMPTNTAEVRDSDPASILPQGERLLRVRKFRSSLSAPFSQRVLARKALAKSNPIFGVRFWGWTGSSCGFDPVLGVLILELHRAEIAKSRVQPP